MYFSHSVRFCWKPRDALKFNKKNPCVTWVNHRYQASSDDASSGDLVKTWPSNGLGIISRLPFLHCNTPTYWLYPLLEFWLYHVLDEPPFCKWITLPLNQDAEITYQSHWQYLLVNESKRELPMFFLHFTICASVLIHPLMWSTRNAIADTASDASNSSMTGVWVEVRTGFQKNT